MMINLCLKRIIKIILLQLICTKIALGNFVSNGFLVKEERMDYTNTVRFSTCTGTIPYPHLSNDDEELIMLINDEIEDFAELYALCNHDEHDHYSVRFDIPESGTKGYFSVRWLTNNSDQPYRIDVLNFNRDTGDLLEINDIFNPLSKNLIGELIKLSQGHLAQTNSWEDFIEKVEKKEIQFYLEKEQWFLIFNSGPNKHKLLAVKIPEIFLKGERR